MLDAERVDTYSVKGMQSGILGLGLSFKLHFIQIYMGHLIMTGDPLQKLQVEICSTEVDSFFASQVLE
jgi:hypothetical protein